MSLVIQEYLLFDRNKCIGTDMQIRQKSRLMMSSEFLLLTCCADLSTGDQLIIRRKYPNAPESESELFTGDTSE